VRGKKSSEVKYKGLFDYRRSGLKKLERLNLVLSGCVGESALDGDCYIEPLN